MSYRRFLLIPILLALGLSCRQPGISPENHGGQAIRYGDATVMGQSIESPYVLELPRRGDLIFELGNPSDDPIYVSLGSAKPNRALLPGKRWTQIQVTSSESLTLTWQGGPLTLGSRYLKPRRMVQPPNVLLVSVDTLRWDRFTQKHMPGLAGLFEKGRVFSNAYSTTPWTLPAHASLLSGQYPAKHGVRVADAKLPAAVETLAERLRAGGYYNWAMTEGNFVSARYGLDQGFHRYIEVAPQMMEAEARKVSKLAVNLDRARARIDQLAGVPQFLFLHTYEVHCPYLVRGEEPDPQGEGQTKWLLDHDGEDLEQATYDHIAKLYDDEVAYTDRLLTPFIRSLWETGNWLIIFTSDHGEEFGDHGGLLHGDTLYQEALHVPLGILGPKIEASTVDQACSLIDVAPTILDYVEMPSPSTWQGQSLLQEFTERPVFAESFFWGVHIPVENPQLLGVIDAERKLIQAQNFGEIQAELYFLKQDPKEKQNRQEQAVSIRDQLFLLLDAYQKNESLTPDQAEDLTPEQLEAMRALGYIQ